MYNRQPPWAATFKPSAEIAPQDVVKIQLSVLQNNDLTPDDAGIRTAFRFASPDNKTATGPVARFIELVKTPLYGALIGFERVELETMRLTGEIAQQRVTVHHRDGESASFVFTLSKQPADSDCPDCWMTDGVLRVD